MVTIKRQDGSSTTLQAETGTNLRKILLENNLSPYTSLTKKLNCGGRGLCATCGVFIQEGPKPTHWHDKLAHDWNYPRLSCQVTIKSDLHIEIPKKLIWGSRRK
jgi:ferredoxin